MTWCKGNSATVGWSLPALAWHFTSHSGHRFHSSLSLLFVCVCVSVSISVCVQCALMYNTIQYKTYNAPYVTKMLFVGAGILMYINYL